MVDLRLPFVRPGNSIQSVRLKFLFSHRNLLGDLRPATKTQPNWLC